MDSSLYELAADSITYQAVRDFVTAAEAANALSESVTLELKERPDRRNVVQSVAALANTDGGLVLVGVADKGKRGESRLVGVPRATVDSLVNQLRTLIPDAMPEVIPVALPDDDGRVVIVLRVDADAVTHPVVVSGTVFHRVPGQSVPATRDVIRLLCQRDGVGAQPTNDSGLIIQQGLFSPGDTPMWPDGLHPAVMLRLYGSVTLATRVLARPWLDAAAKRVAASVLRGSPVPSLVWLDSPDPSQLCTWQVVNATSTSVSLRGRVEAHDRMDRPTCEGSVRLHLAGRQLQVVVALGTWPSPGQKVGLDSLHEGLLAVLITHETVARAIARQLGADAPLDWGTMQAWFQTGRGLGRLDDYLDLGLLRREGEAREMGTNWPLPMARPRRGPTDGLDEIARSWLETFLLDLAVADFESELAQLTLPSWVSAAQAPAQST